MLFGTLGTVVPVGRERSRHAEVFKKRIKPTKLSRGGGRQAMRFAHLSTAGERAIRTTRNSQCAHGLIESKHLAITGRCNSTSKREGKKKKKETDTRARPGAIPAHLAYMREKGRFGKLIANTRSEWKRNCLPRAIPPWGGAPHLSA